MSCITINILERRFASLAKLLMSYEFLYLLEVMDATINKKELFHPSHDIDFCKFVELSENHMVSSIIYPTVSKVASSLDISTELLGRLKNYTLRHGMAQMRKKSYLLEVLKEFNKHDIPMILLKGPIIAELYPVPSARISVDSDIFIRVEDEERVRLLLTQELSYVAETNPSEVYVLTYHRKDYHIEVHSSLWEDDKGERYDRLTSLGIDSFDNIEMIEVNGISTRTMTMTNTLVYLFYHMVKHFMIKGMGIRYLSDISLFISNYHGEIDFDMFWKSMDILGYRTFCIDFLILSYNFCSLDLNMIGGLSENDKTKNINEKLLLDIEEGGHSGCSTPTRDGATGILWNYYINQNLVSSKKMNLFTYLQLFINKCKARRPENKTDKIYSKYIWIRGFQYFCYLVSTQRKRRDERGEFKDIVDTAKKRVDLMKNLNLFS